MNDVGRWMPENVYLNHVAGTTTNKVRCPFCGAPSGKPCLTSAGYRAQWPHAQRRDLRRERLGADVARFREVLAALEQWDASRGVQPNPPADASVLAYTAGSNTERSRTWCQSVGSSR